jgi:hypothetical protein
VNETTRLLEQMAERCDDSRLAPAAAVRMRAAQFTRRRRTRWGVAAALVAAAATTWSLVSRPSGDPQPVKPPHGVTLPPRVSAPEGPPTVTTHLPGQGEFWVRAVAYHHGTWLALGETHDRKHSLGWVSRDGEHWTPQDVPEGLGHGIDSMTDTPDGFAAVGSLGRDQYVWTSPDGTTWRPPARLPWPDGSSVMYAYRPFWTSHGLFVVGDTDGYGSYLWRSRDEGRHWKAVGGVDVFRDGPGCEHKPKYADRLHWISERDGTLIAGGSCDLWQSNTPQLALTYTSTDGEHWTKSTRRYGSAREPVIWGNWDGPILTTKDPHHFARVHDHGQVEVWRAPSD